MTYQSPRIYTYKITFEEVPYYYYGMHQEKVYGEKYWGSPITNKWCWNFYTPKKQILETFDSRYEAYEVEKRLIKPVINDKLCLNAHVGGYVSIDVYRKVGNKNKELGLGIHSFTKKKRIEVSKRAGKRCYELRSGVHSRTPEQMARDGRKSVETHRKNKTGAFDPERKLQSKAGKVGGRHNVESGHLQKISELKYICLETGFISSARGINAFQKTRGIDLSKRRLLTTEEYREKTKRQFTVISSTGKIYIDDDIDKFCKEHKLTKPLFVDLLDGRKISHHGFHLPNTELKFYVEFTIKTPEGEIVEGKNISKFCRDYSTEDNKLSVSEVHKLIRGKIDCYRGFTVVK
jgi:hypothetical protein